MKAECKRRITVSSGGPWLDLHKQALLLPTQILVPIKKSLLYQIEIHFYPRQIFTLKYMLNATG